jgi:hypothetical protein
VMKNTCAALSRILRAPTLASMTRALSPSMPMINVVEPQDIVLAQIAADLHLD